MLSPVFIHKNCTFIRFYWPPDENKADAHPIIWDGPSFAPHAHFELDSSLSAYLSVDVRTDHEEAGSQLYLSSIYEKAMHFLYKYARR